MANITTTTPTIDDVRKVARAALPALFGHEGSGAEERAGTKPPSSPLQPTTANAPTTALLNAARYLAGDPEFSGAPYKRPVQKTVTLAFDATPFTIRTGLTLVTAGTSGGKSIIARALALAALDAGYPTLVIPMSEPDQNGPFDDTDTLPAFLTPDEAGKAVNGSIYGKLALFAAQARAVLSDYNSVLGRAPIDDPSLPIFLVFDSIALVMRSFGSVDVDNVRARRATQGTMPGGMQPSDIEFTAEFHRLAIAQSFVALCPINPDIAPFAAQLEAICEGRLIVNGPSSFMGRGRFNKRTYVPFEVPTRFVAATTEGMGYGTYSPGAADAGYLRLID